MYKFILFATLLFSLEIFSQETFPVNGTLNKDYQATAFTNATIVIDSQRIIQNGTLLIKQGKILNVGTDVNIPKDAVVHDMEGKYIYPSFIDLHSSYGLPEVKKAEWNPRPQYTSNRKGAFGWNESIKADYRAAEEFSHNDKEAASLRKIGFGTVVSHRFDGIARGTSALVTLGKNENKNLLRPDASVHFSFNKGSSRQNYPSSLMGAIALLKQTYFDAQWYSSPSNQEEENLTLAALLESKDLPAIFAVNEKWDILRADRIGDEQGIQYIFKGFGDEYQRIDEIRKTNGILIIPLNFPKAIDMSDPILSRMVSLNEMKHWELAAGNPAALESAGLQFAITSDGLNEKNDFLKNLRTAVDRGLSKGTALSSLTTIPAKLIGAEDLIGSLDAGKEANFIICSADIFDEGSEIYENWVQGESFILKEMNPLELAGEYNLNVNKVFYSLEVTGEAPKYKSSITFIKSEGEARDTLKTDVKLSQNDRLLSFSFQLENGPQTGLLRFSGNVYNDSRIWDGKAQLENGEWVDWVAVKQAKDETSTEQEPVKKDSIKTPEVFGAMRYPMLGYGWEIKPEAKTLLIKNAKLWTCEEEGIIEKGQLLIHDGKIVAVGEYLDLASVFGKNIPEIEELDAKGKHVTPGIIDEHTHIAATRGVNEGTQASSAEVSIGDVINPDDINIYRHLAGGVTAGQVLHGSANPIGGQSGIIKFRWGQDPESMKIKNADPFIKFALGENVKQSNWGSNQTSRFPQTRMGVEQVYYDLFHKAREYQKEWDAYDGEVEKLSNRQRRKGQLPNAPRRDLELECLNQILKSERFVTCHSYVQSEINMLMHVADSMGFTLNTFTHILEGYKVADKMKEHGAGGSSFSDWWAYKFEVKDAIPYNGAILWSQGVVTAFNSDDSEMARRLNQEAAKAVKYGGVPEEEALKFVTLNPAILLHLDHRMGSLKAGKDADIVIWSDNPLSVYAKAEKTFVDGICYFDMEEDGKRREEIRLERARITQKMMNSGNKDEMRKPSKKPDRHYHCDTLEDELHIHNGQINE